MKIFIKGFFYRFAWDHLHFAWIMISDKSCILNDDIKNTINLLPDIIRVFLVLSIKKFWFFRDMMADLVYLIVCVWINFAKIQLDTCHNHRDSYIHATVSRHSKSAAVREKIYKDISNSLGKRWSCSAIHTTALSF